MGEDGRGLADDQGRELDVDLGLVAEVGDGFALGGVVIMTGGGGRLIRGAVAMVVSGGRPFTAAIEQ